MHVQHDDCCEASQLTHPVEPLHSTTLSTEITCMKPRHPEVMDCSSPTHRVKSHHLECRVVLETDCDQHDAHSRTRTHSQYAVARVVLTCHSESWFYSHDATVYDLLASSTIARSKAGMLHWMGEWKGGQKFTMCVWIGSGGSTSRGTHPLRTVLQACVADAMHPAQISVRPPVLLGARGREFAS